MFVCQDVTLELPFFRLKNLNFTLKAHEILLLVGASGSGKSLALKLFSGLLKPSSGSIIIDEIDSSQLPPAKRSTGLVLQEASHNFLMTSVFEELLFTLECYRIVGPKAETIASALLEKFELDAQKNLHPLKLSGGQQRRLAILNLLAAKCQILLFDEPFANLDLKSIQLFLASLTELQTEGKTLIIATHELEKIWLKATHLLALKAGTQCFFGSIAEAKAGLDWQDLGLKNPFSDPLQW